MFKRGKKGQITVFLIIGIVLLLVIGSFFYLRKEVTLQPEIINQELIDVPNGEGVNFFVQNCLASISEEGVLKVGRQGGYYQSPLDYSILFFDDMMPYYYADEKTMFQTIDGAEKELEKYIEKNLPLCINDFNAFKQEKYLIETGEMQVDVEFGSQVTIKLYYPISIQRGITVTELSSFVYDVNVNFPKYFSISEQLVNSSLEKPGYVCLTCMDNLAAMENMKIESYPIYDPTYYANDYIWFRLEDKPAKRVSGSNFSFEFVIEYVQPESEEPLLIESIDTLNVRAGELFTYQIITNHPAVKFNDNTDLFEIDDFGIISFTPSNNQKRSYFITITAVDSNGEIDEELFLLKVM